MILELKKARHLLASSGWVGAKLEPYCVVDRPGVRLNAGYGEQGNVDPLWASTKWFKTLEAHRAGILRYSVRGACSAAGVDFGQLEELLETDELQSWLYEPNRTREEVLGAMLRAIERSKKATGERR